MNEWTSPETRLLRKGPHRKVRPFSFQVTIDARQEKRNRQLSSCAVAPSPLVGEGTGSGNPTCEICVICGSSFFSASVAEAHNVAMKRILITGLSGTGKSTVIVALAARGFWAVDLDDEAFSEWVTIAEQPELAEAAGSPVEPDRDWVWREDRVGSLLDREQAATLFVGGCAANMRRFLPRFDEIVLLTAPAEVIADRLRSRSNNPYGKHPDEVERVLGLIQTVEPLLRKTSTREIDTREPLDEVIAKRIAVAEPAT